MATDLKFDVSALDKASSTFLKLAKTVEKFEKRLEELDGKRVSADVDVNTSKAEREVGAFATKTRRQLEQALKALPDIEIDADSSDAQREVARIRSEMQALADKKIGVDIDAATAHAEMTRLRAELERLGTESADIQVQADTAAAIAALKVVDAEASKLDGKNVKVKVDVDKSLGDALIHVTRLGEALAQLALPAAAVAAAPQIASIGAAAVTATGALALIPAAGAAAALGVGAVALGFSNLGDALGEGKKAEEAMAKLSDNGKELVASLKELSPAWSELRKAVQDAFLDQAGKSVEQLAKTYLPTLRTNLVEIADAFNTAGQGATKFLTAPAVAKDLSAAFGNAREAIVNASGAIEPMTRAITDLVSVGSSRLPALGQSIADAAESFADFIDRARESGQLGQWIDNGINALKTLGSIAGNIGSALSSIFSAANAAGADFLGTVDQLTGKIAEFLRSAQGQSALVSLFQDIRAGVEAATPGVEALIRAIAGVVQALGDAGVLEAAGRAFTAIAEQVAPLISSLGGLAPALRTILDVVAALAPVLVPLATSFAAIKLATNGLDKLGGIATSFSTLGKSAQEADGKVGGLRGKLDGLKGLGPTIGFTVALAGIEVATGQIHSLAEEFRKLPEAQRSALQDMTVGFDNWLQSFEPGAIGDKFAATNWGDFWDPNGQLSAKWQGFVNSINGVQIDPIELDVNDQLPRQKLTEITNLVNSSSPTVNINGRDTGAGQALADILQAINTGQGTVKINGVDTDAQAALKRVVDIINATMGYVQVNGEMKPAGDALRDWIAAAQGTPGPNVKVGVETPPASEVNDGVSAALSGISARIPVNPDGTPLKEQLPALAADVANTPGNMPIQADGAPFAGALPAVAAQASTFPATITVQGNTIPASEALQGVLNAVNTGSGVVTINGNQVPATTVLAALMGSVNASNGTVTINGQDVPAQTALSGVISAINAGSGTVTLNGRDIPARDVLAALIAAGNSSVSTHTINGNGANAYSVIQNLKQPTFSTHTITVVVNGLQRNIDPSIGGGRITGSGGAVVGYSGGGIHGYAGGGVHRPSRRRGMVIPGYAPGVDDQNAVLAKGEAVLVPELVRTLGARRILAANAEASGGRPATVVGQVARMMDGSIGRTHAPMKAASSRPGLTLRASGSRGQAASLSAAMADGTRQSLSTAATIVGALRAHGAALARQLVSLGDRLTQVERSVSISNTFAVADLNSAAERVAKVQRTQAALGLFA